MISIIIPMWNEEWRAPSTVADIYEYAKRDKRITEVVVVDDGSSDRSFERIVKYQMKKKPVMTMLKFVKNRGKWAAVRDGIDAARNDWVLLLDADHAARVEELRAIDVDLEKTRGRAFFGSRFMKGAKMSGKSLLRTIVSNGYRVYVRLLYRYATGNKAPDDMQCPWKLFRKSELIGELSVDRWAGDIELALNLMAKVENVPVLFMHQAKSKMRWTAIFSMAYETFIVALRYRGGNAIT